LEQKVEGLESSELKNIKKIFPEDVYPVAPEPLSGFFFFPKRTQKEGLLVEYLSELPFCQS
jgi:hypothetical protein